jgi:hypothetical protein
MYRKLLDRGSIPIILFFLAASAATGAFLPRFQVDAGTNVLLNEDDPDLAYYNITRAEWSYDEYAIVCARRDDWFSPESLALLKEIVEELKRAPQAKSVLSILSIPLLRSPRQIVPVPVYLDNPKVEIPQAKAEILAHTQAQGNLISADGRDLSILVYLNVPEAILRLEPQWSRAQGLKDKATLKRISGEYDAALGELKARRTQLITAVREIASRFSPRMNEPIRLSGLPIITVNLVEHVSADLKIFGVTSLAFFTLAFLAVYRRARWTAMPILACLLPVVLIVGTMAMTGKKVTVITSNLPVLLFVLMLPYTVYFVERYRERRSLFPGESNLDSSEGGAREIWTPCLYSCTTTMAGFASLLTSGINPVRVFGLMMTIGMGVGLACVFLFLPSMSRPLRALEIKGAGAASETRGVVRGLEKLVLHAPGWVLALSLVILGVSVWGATKLTVETKFIDYFWPRSEVYQGLDYIDKRMGGTTPMEVMLTSTQPGYFKTTQGLEAIDAASRYFAAVPETGSVRSFKTMVDEARKYFTSKQGKVTAKDEAITGAVQKVAPEMVRDFCNPDFTVTRVLVRFKETAPTLNRKRILDGLGQDLRSRPELANLNPRPTGVFVLYSNMLQSLIQSQKDTFAMVVVMIWVMLAVLFGRFPGLSQGASTALGVLCFVATASGLGAWLWPRERERTLLVLTETRWVLLWLGLSILLLLLASIALAIRKRGGLGSLGRWALDVLALPTIVLVPQVLPVLVVLGTMGLTGIALDMVTVMIASIAMGVGIDAAIQYTVRYRIELDATGGDRRAAVTRSHATIGRAIWIATTIMVIGFAVLALSDFVPTVWFGVFNALAMLMGQFAALTVLPALFLLTGLPRSR